MPVRVAVLAADPFARAGVSGALTGRPGILVVEGGADVVVVLSDPALLDGLDPAARVVLVSDEPGRAAVRAVRLPRRELTTASLLRAIRDADRGRSTLPEPGELIPEGLSSREIDVLRLLAEGRDTAEIAAELAYAERTVKNILSGLLARHALRNRTHAVAYALRLGLI